MRNADGDQVLTLVDCWRSSEHYAGQSERCYDMFGGSMAKAGARRLVSKVKSYSLVKLYCLAWLEDFCCTVSDGQHNSSSVLRTYAFGH